MDAVTIALLVVALGAIACAVWLVLVALADPAARDLTMRARARRGS